MRLVAFISLRDLKKNKEKILRDLPDAMVLPMLPKAAYWKWNVITLFFVCLFKGERSIIARNVIATNMALRLSKFGLIKKVCFDGRGAIAAEWKEYDVQVHPQWKKSIVEMEHHAVMRSDFRIAVTNELVNYWKKDFGYKKNDHVIIPCTVNTRFTLNENVSQDITKKKSELNISEKDIVFVYSGSTAGWQSFAAVDSFITPLLKKSKKYKIIFLAQKDANIDQLKKQFPGQVIQQWVSHNEVQKTLAACDYGILIREQTITNKVAAPTKFAEYLSAGLPVIISPNLGDYSDFVEKNQCGFVANGRVGSIDKPEETKKQRMKELVLKCFTKEAFKEQYRELLKAMS